MVERGEGQIVFIASLSGKAASPRSSIYDATKFGLRGFALSLRDRPRSYRRRRLGRLARVRPRGGDVRRSRERGAPAGLGTTTPERVAAAVVRAIERNKVEVAVAPIRQRALAHFGMAIPGLAVRAQSGGVAKRATREIDAGHRAARSAGGHDA